MSLFYVDKGSDNRIVPSVNSPDVHLNRKAHATDSIAIRGDNTADSGKITTKNDQIVASDESTPRIIFGRLPDGTYGIAISKPGEDVNEAFS
jgi:hypothetical protein